MRILVLGASSNVGSALANAFCRKNNLILVGRNVGRLIAAANRCKDSGAAQVEYIEQDFYLGADSLLQGIEGKTINLIIDAASASSRKRDVEIQSGDISQFVSSDFLTKTKIMDHILHSQEEAPAVIFVSTVLTFVKSPGRTIYSTLKALYEAYLIKLRDSRSDLRLLVVYVGTVIDAKNASNKANNLASAVFKAFNRKNEKLFFGVSGMLFVALYYFQPVIFYLVTLAQRRIRRWFG